MISSMIPAFSVSAEENTKNVTTESSTQSTQTQTQETTVNDTAQETPEEGISLESSPLSEESAETEVDGAQAEEEKTIEIISEKIDSDRIKVTGASSEANGTSGDNTTGSGGEKENVIDGDLGSLWHTAWNKNDAEKYIEFELNDVVPLTKIKYFRRSYDVDNGVFNSYTVYVKTEKDADWQNVKSGSWTWQNPNREQTIEFEETVKAKYIKIVANTTVGNYASAAEIEFYENVATRPEITTQPHGGYSEENKTIEVVATSTDSSQLSYQWYENEKNSLFGATAIQNATDSRYTVNLNDGEKKYYFVKVTNADTGISILSDVVMVGRGTAAAMVNNQSYGSLAEAIAAATTNSVVYVLRDQEIDATININKSITIEAEAGTTVTLTRAQSFISGYMFNISNSAVLNISRTASGKVIIDGGRTSDNNFVTDNGAFQITKGALNLNSNGIIRNNYSTFDGGAIYTSAGGNSTVKIYGEISGNHSNGDGGAICSNGYLYVYATSVFSNNSANGNGGAINNNNGGIVTVSGGNHHGNSAGENGGFFYADGKTTISGGTIQGNTANGNGGGIYSYNTPNTTSRVLEFTGGSITGNTADSGNDVYTRTKFTTIKGNTTIGDIYIPSGETVMFNGALTGSIGVSYGGEPTAAGTDVIVGSGYTIKATDAQKVFSADEKMVTDFANSKVIVKYAPVKITQQPQSIDKVSMGEVGTLTIGAQSLTGTAVSYQWYKCDENGENGTPIEGATSETFNPDTAKEGTFYYYCQMTAEKADTAKSDVVFVRVVDSSKAEVPIITQEPQGGTYDIRHQTTLAVDAMVTDGGTLTYQWYKANDEAAVGEAIQNGTDKTLTLQNEESGTFYYYCIVTNTKTGLQTPTATANSQTAQVVVTEAAAAFNGTKYSNFSEALAALKAANYSGTLEIYKNVTLNETINVGSGVNLEIRGTANPEGNVPKITLANGFGSEAFVVNGGKLTINSVAIDGGAVWVANGMYYETYLGRGSRNNGRSSGKPLVTINGGGTVTLNGSAALQNNVANWVSGGAVVINNGTLNMNDSSKIVNNYASSHGGALFASSANSTVNISGNSEISGNQGGQSTGGICADTGTKLNISGGVIKNNFTGGRGGGVFINGTLTMTAGEIRDNYAGTYGGGIIVSGNTTNISGGTITNNRSATYGAGIASLAGTTTISGSAKITNNNAGGNGGGIATTGGILVVNGGTFSGNNAGGNGGAIYRSTENSAGRIDIDFTKITFENNKSVVTGENQGTTNNVYVTRGTTLGTINANVTNNPEFYDAIYFEHTFVVTLHTDMDGATINKSVRFMGQYELTNLERNGYEFLGWFDSANGGNKVENGSCVLTKSNHNLYAHWNRTATNTITVTLQPVGGVMYKEDVNTLTTAATIATNEGGEVPDATLSYQWYEWNNENNTATAIDGAKEASYTIDTSDKELGIYYYFCIVSGTNAADEKTDTVKVELISKNVAVTPIFNTQPNNVDCFVGDDAVFTANATTVDLGTITYQWYRSTDNVATPETDELISGATEASYCENTSKAGTYYYYVVATNTIIKTDGQPNTATATSNVAKLSCHNKISVSDVSANDTIMTPAYWDKYGVGYQTTGSLDDYIKNVACNYGSYGQNTVGKAFDRNWNSFWETNTGNVKNYLEFKFSGSVKVDRILYATRQDGYKGRGYPTTLTIYKADDNNNFVEVGVAKSSEKTGYVLYTFPETVEFSDKMRFEFTVSTFNNWASAAELILLRDESTVIDGTATITGNAAVGQTLTANATVIGTDNLNYQWQSSENGSDFTNITNATSKTYTITEDVKDKYIRVIVRDGSGKYSGSVVSADYRGTFESYIDGQGVVGETLAAATKYTDTDAQFEYVWQRGSSKESFENIGFQTGSTYKVSVFDINSYIRVGIMLQGTNEYVYSEPIFVDVQAIMTGAPQVGGVLTASLTGCNDSVTYRWQISDSETEGFTDIPEATYSEYTIPAEYVNKYIRVIIKVTESSREMISEAWQIASEGTYPVASGDYIYLTDMPKEHLVANKVGFGNLMYDRNTSNGTISLKVNGERTYFMKGIGAHAASYVVFDVQDYVKYYHFDRLTAYLGLDFAQGSNGDGVTFQVMTAETYNGDSTVWKTVRNITTPYKGTSEAYYLDLDLTGVNYVKIAFGNYGSTASDHSVIADAKLISKNYKPEDISKIIKTVEQYDQELKAYEAQGKTYTELLKNEDYEKLLLQRTFVNNATYSLVKSFLYNEENIQTMDWFMNDIEALRLYIGGGKPDGTYSRSLEVLNRLYSKHKADLADSANGSLYKKMMITLSLTHSANVAFWQDGSQQSDPVRRYEIYKKLYDNGLLITDVFKNLEVEEMRWVMNNINSDDQIEWLNYYVRYHTNVGNKEINKNNYTPGPYYFITYTMGFNYNQPRFYDSNKQVEWETKWKLDNQYLGQGISSSNVQNKEKIKVYDIDVEYGKVKLWIVFEAGAVCGGISKTGSNLNTVFGIPSVVIGQPGHAAYLQFSTSADNTTGSWGIYNDISGWTGSEKGERMLNGWGNSNWDSAYQVSYVLLAQAALNQPNKYYEAEKLIDIANMYPNNPEKRIAIYREAIAAQSINMDAWLGMIDAYKQAKKTQAEFAELAGEISNALTYYPLPMWDILQKLIKPNLTDEKYIGEVSTCQTMALTKAKNATANDTLQNTACKTMANHLLGNNNFKMATFSFDGNKANTIVLNEMYNGGNEVMICLDGHPENEGSWINLGTGTEFKLSDNLIQQITAENDIHVRLQGTKSYYTIDITNGTLPKGLYLNDNENRITGDISNLEYKTADESEWHDLTKDVTFPGDVTITVRKKATGTAKQSGTQEYTFTYDKDSDDRKYIPLSQVQYIGCSSEQVDKSGSAVHALDGNINTYWHTWWAGGDSQRYIIVKLKEPVYLTAFDYTPVQEGNGNGRFQTCEIYTSMTGEDNSWTLSGRATGWGNTPNKKSLELYNPVYTQYIKVRAAQAVGNFGSGSMFEFFQDTTVDNKEIESISIKSKPDKLNYVVGDELDISGLEVLAQFTDKTNGVINNSMLKFDPTIFDSVGNKTITVTSAQNSNAKASFDVTVSENNKTVSDIFVSQMPDNTRYFVGDTLNTTGLVVKANYTDGSQGYLFESQYTVSPTTLDTAGKEIPVTVTYKESDISTTFNVEVTKTVKEIMVTQVPEKENYYLGDTLDTTGIVVSVKYTDNTVEELESYDYIVDTKVENPETKNSENFSDTSGTKKITVKYQRNEEIKTTFSVLVYPYITYNGLRYESVDNKKECYVSGLDDELSPNSIVTVPSTVKVGDLEFTVVGLGKDSANATGAFENQTDLVGINLPSTVTNIKADAFKGCTNLREIYLNEHTDFTTLVVDSGAFANDENSRGKIYVANADYAAALNGLIANGGNVKGLKYFSAEAVTSNILSMEITLPEKLDYHLGESLDLTGMKVIGVTTDGQKIELADSLYTVSPLESETAGNKTIKITLNNTAVEAEFPVKVIPATPEITKQPVGNVYTTGAEKAALTVEASISDKGTLTYQWYSNTVESTDGATKIDTATEATYQPTEDAKKFYYVVVTNNDHTGNGNTAISVTSDIVCVDVGDYTAKIEGVGYNTIQEAVNAAQDGDKIEVIKDVDLISQITINKSNTNITISGKKIKRTTDTSSVALLRIEAGNVVLEDIIIDGGAVWSGTADGTLNRGISNNGISSTNTLVNITGGSLTLSNGGVLQNNYNKSDYSESGGAVRINNSSKLVLDGGSILNNYCDSYGGALISFGSSSVVINSGTVSGNHARNSGGTFCVDNSSTITINGGTIKNNKGNTAGGVIWVAGSTVTLNGGEIKNNASGTGTVYMSGNGTVNLGNITMSGNTSAKGSAVYNGDGTVKITGRPSLSDNTIYLTNGKNISVQSNLTGADKIVVTGDNMTSGRVIATAANADFAKAAAETLQVSKFSTYIDGNNVKIGNVVNLSWQTNLPESKTIFAGTQVELEALATGSDNITYKWYICDNAQGDNPKEINTTAQEGNKLIYGDCGEGTCYFYCVATVNDGISPEIKSQICAVNVIKFVPCSQAIEKFKNL